MQKRKVRYTKKHYISSDKVHCQSQWEPLSKAILYSAAKGKALNIAKSLESHENHEVVVDQVMKVFSTGNKLTNKDLKYNLLNGYIEKLKDKNRLQKKTIKRDEEIAQEQNGD